MSQSLIWNVIESAITTADEHAAPDWKLAAAACIRHLAERKPEITADDVVEDLEQFFPSVTTHNLAALGPVFRNAAKSGVIRNTNRMVQSRIPRRHRKITVWKSLIHQPREKAHALHKSATERNSPDQ